MAYSLTVEAERVNQSESGGGIHRRWIRGGHHLTKVKNKSHCSLNIYRLTQSASELSGFTCTSSLNEREISIPHEAAEFIVSERVQLNPDNSRAMSVLTFLLFKLNTLQTKIVKL